MPVRVWRYIRKFGGEKRIGRRRIRGNLLEAIYTRKCPLANYEFSEQTGRAVLIKPNQYCIQDSGAIPHDIHLWECAGVQVGEGCASDRCHAYVLLDALVVGDAVVHDMLLEVANPKRLCMSKVCCLVFA